MMLIKKEFVLIRAGDYYKMLMKRGSCTDCIYHNFCEQVLLSDPNNNTIITDLETICSNYPGYITYICEERKRNL